MYHIIRAMKIAAYDILYTCSYWYIFFDVWSAKGLPDWSLSARIFSADSLSEPGVVRTDYLFNKEEVETGTEFSVAH